MNDVLWPKCLELCVLCMLLSMCRTCICFLDDGDSVRKCSTKSRWVMSERKKENTFDKVFDIVHDRKNEQTDRVYSCIYVKLPIRQSFQKGCNVFVCE